MDEREALFDYLLRLGDNSLILAQRLAELVGRAPQLEEEMALANIALDLLGRARLLLAYAGEVEGRGRDEDDLAYRRDVRELRNALIVEQPNGDFAHQIGRIFLMAAHDCEHYEALKASADRHLAGIAEKSVKEVAYHLSHAGDWVVRLGDGTEESRRRMQQALGMLWPYTGELFAADEVDRLIHHRGIGPDLAFLEAAWDARIDPVLEEATLSRPAAGWRHKGGKDGRMHSEHLGHLLAELQFLQRAYPDARQW
jgi:ring-1,2-phenylacetyl-CoA epoxidase subunit PaaC